MPVPLSPSIVVPSVAEKTYNQKFYTLLELRPTPTTAPASFQWCPQTAAGEVDYSAPRTFKCDLWTVAQSVPEAAAALDACLAAFPAIEAWLTAKEANP